MCRRVDAAPIALAHTTVLRAAPSEDAGDGAASAAATPGPLRRHPREARNRCTAVWRARRPPGAGRPYSAPAPAGPANTMCICNELVTYPHHPTRGTPAGRPEGGGTVLARYRDGGGRRRVCARAWRCPWPQGSRKSSPGPSVAAGPPQPPPVWLTHPAGMTYGMYVMAIVTMS